MSSELIERLNSALASRYQIKRQLGSGGMGLVFLADDLKHSRPVALKLLRPGLSTALGAERFVSEIRLAARLQHPSIVPVFDSGEADGLLYFVMPYLEGESLRALLSRNGPLPIDETLRIARDLAEALEYAHARDVIHRDVKPENVLIASGRAVLVDFGIAGAIQLSGSSGLTETGIVLGTPQYMAPEQASPGTPLDARTDVYALASVVYEMLTGEPPYTGRTAQHVLAKRLNDPIPRARRLRETVPVNVEEALIRALARIPADRFASARMFADALSSRELTAVVSKAVAVLPFRNLSPDTDNGYFADGMTEDVITHLSKIKGLKIIAGTSVRALERRDRSHRDIADQLGVATLLDGSVRRAGERLRIVAQLIDAESGCQVWADTYDRDVHDIFAIQTDVARQIATALKVEISGTEQTRLARKPTSDLEAYHWYLKARQCLLRYSTEGIRQGLTYLEEAIRRDDNFALAHTSIAQACVLVGMGFGGSQTRPAAAYERAREAITRALHLDAELADAHGTFAFLSFVADFDWVTAERAFNRALDLNPSSFIWDTYGLMLSALGRYDQALAAQQHAQELDPLAAVHAADIATTLLRAGRYAEALHEAEQLIKFAPQYPIGYSTLGWAEFKLGNRDAGLSALERAVALSSQQPMLIAQLGQAYAMAGKTDAARSVLHQLHELGQRRYVSPYHLAYVYTGLGEHDEAITLLEQAYAERAGGLYGVKGSFLFTSLHSHPRFAALLRRMNLATK
jgi:eukaryotic-like serine/threonine-protein kinase